MPDYQNGKVYKIVSKTDDDICYVGSTTLPLLCSRMAEHRSHYKYLKAGKKVGNLTSHILFDTYGVENCRIELLETVPCNSKDELIRREAFYIRSLNCVNKNIAGRTKQEWYEDHPEYYKKWCEANRDKISERYTCICGSSLQKYNKTTHERCQKHKDYCISVSVSL